MSSEPGRLEIETIFQAEYQRVTRVIARVLRDPARAEELAVEVFLKWSRNPQAQGRNGVLRGVGSMPGGLESGGRQEGAGRGPKWHKC